MNNTLYSTILCFSILALASCDKKPQNTTETPSKPEASQNKEQVTKSEFKPEVFTSILRQGSQIRLISETECELECEGVILLATYAKDPNIINKIRFVLNVRGSQMVTYAEAYSDGIVMRDETVFKDGEALLTVEGMKQKEEADRIAKEKMDRIIRDAPTMLIGLWDESRINSDKPDVIAETYIRLFKNDGTWAEGSATEMRSTGKWWMVANTNEIEMDFGPAAISNLLYKIVELSDNSYTIELHKRGLTKRTPKPTLVGTLTGKRNDSSKVVQGGATNTNSAAMNDSVTEVQKTRVISDLQGLATNLMLYNARFAQYPTMEQGLNALVNEPTVGPVPYKWMQFQVSIPKDPWNNEYRFRIPTTSKSQRDVFDVFSLGPDGIVSEDDIILSK